jgi:catechol 2,3-dioxygenase-like lactoylglutathione lyase family enzyme
VSIAAPVVRLRSDKGPNLRRRHDMKPNSISGITYHVEDLARTTDFYETLGFRRGKEEPGRVTFYVNWFFVTFIARDHESDRPANGAGQFLYVKVDDAEAFHTALLAEGMDPAGEPQKGPSGGREFLLRDPDGYNLVFFQKK